MRRAAPLLLCCIVSGCSYADVLHQPGAANAASSVAAAAKQTAANLLYVDDSDGDRVNFYAYKDGVAGKLAGTIKETNPTGVCSDNQGDVYVVSPSERQIVKFAHGATVPTSTIQLRIDYPYECAVDPSTGNIAVSIKTAHNKFNQGWVVELYTSAGALTGSYYATVGFTAIRALAFDSQHDVFALASPCESSGYCLDNSNGGPPTLFELTPSGYAFDEVNLNGVTLVNPTGLAWIDPSLLVGDADYKNKKQPVGLKLIIGTSGATLKGTILFTDTGLSDGIAVRAGVALVTDDKRGEVRSYSITDGSLLSTLLQTKVLPVDVTVSQAK
jgi:hypothetical protein